MTVNWWILIKFCGYVCIFLGRLECVGHSFTNVAHLWFLRDVWIRTQSAAGASGRTSNLVTHPTSHYSLSQLSPYLANSQSSHYLVCSEHLYYSGMMKKHRLTRFCVRDRVLQSIFGWWHFPFWQASKTSEQKMLKTNRKNCKWRCILHSRFALLPQMSNCPPPPQFDIWGNNDMVGMSDTYGWGGRSCLLNGRVIVHKFFTHY